MTSPTIEKRKMTNLMAVKTFFAPAFDGQPGRAALLKEWKELSEDDKKELGALCAAELDVEIVEASAIS